MGIVNVHSRGEVYHINVFQVVEAATTRTETCADTRNSPTSAEYEI